MNKLFSAIMAALGLIAAGLGSQGCTILIIDEPEIPENLIK